MTMHNERKITEDMYLVGGSDRRLALFENVYPIPDGISYNSYLVLDEKTVLLDTVDKAVSGIFFENIEAVLGGRNLDYLIVDHMEPDHCAAIGELVLRYPDVKIVGNAKTAAMLGQFFSFDAGSRFVTVKEGDVLDTGRHKFSFYFAPMVHWPEVMVTYDSTDGILYSADAFGTFGALNGNIFADEVDFEEKLLDEARRYYTNIVGKYGVPVQTLLKKASSLEIKMICPLHGPVWRENFGFFIDKYAKWSSCTPEDNTVVIAYGTIYGGTQNAAEILASALAEKGVKGIKMYDVSVTHPSTILAECFRASHIVLAAPTYNGGVFTPMETLINELKAHALQNRTFALIENGSWAATSGKQMRAALEEMKNITVFEETVSVKSAVSEEQRNSLCKLADELAASVIAK